MRHRRPPKSHDLLHGHNRDRGFTLIELLVVVIIVGILAAIAIPVFLNQRKKGVDASLKADLKNAANAAETVAVDWPTSVYFGQIPNGAHPSAIGIARGRFDAAGFKHSAGNVIAVSGGPAAGYRICAYNPNASSRTNATSAMQWDSNAGGLLDTPVDCTPGVNWIALP